MSPRRFYVAYCPGYPTAVLRLKDEPQLAEWRARSWRLFDGKPAHIVDVTDDVAELVFLRLRHRLAFSPAPPHFRWRPGDDPAFQAALAAGTVYDATTHLADDVVGPVGCPSVQLGEETVPLGLSLTLPRAGSEMLAPPALVPVKRHALTVTAFVSRVNDAETRWVGLALPAASPLRAAPFIAIPVTEAPALVQALEAAIATVVAWPGTARA